MWIQFKNIMTLLVWLNRILLRMGLVYERKMSSITLRRKGAMTINSRKRRTTSSLSDSKEIRSIFNKCLFPFQIFSNGRRTRWFTSVPLLMTCIKNFSIKIAAKNHRGHFNAIITHVWYSKIDFS